MNTDSILEEAPKKVVKEIDTTSHKYLRNNYIDWFFKKKQNYVILRQFKNKENITKMYIALPVRERKFVDDKMDLFDVTKLVDIDFPINIKNIDNYETIYSGHMDSFDDFPKYLNTFRFTRKTPSINRWGYNEVLTLYKDYTKTKVEQEHSFTLVPSFLEPELSIVSIFRLLQSKYITVVAVTFKPEKLN